MEPEHRLVARHLAQEWEEKLTAQRQLQEDYDRFLQEHPRPLSPAECEAIQELARNIPALWQAPTTTMADRKAIIRQVIHRVLVAGEGTSECLHLTIEWVGGQTTTGRTTRPIRRTERLSYYPELCARIRTLAEAGQRAGQIAEYLAQEGYRPPKCAERFSRAAVLELMQRLGVHQPRARRRAALAAHEWWISDLARMVGIPTTTHLVRMEADQAHEGLITEQQRGHTLEPKQGLQAVSRTYWTKGTILRWTPRSRGLNIPAVFLG